MKIVQGTLVKIKNDLYLATPNGNYAISSFVDAPKVAKLETGAVINGLVRDYHPTQIALLIKAGWDSNRIGSIETGHLRIGALKE